MTKLNQLRLTGLALIVAALPSSLRAQVTKPAEADFLLSMIIERIEGRPLDDVLTARGLLSSVSDMAKWDASLYGNTLLTDATKKAMWTSVTLPNGKPTNYGFGWDVAPYRGRVTTSHTGQVQGFVTSFTRTDR